jgi:predicted Zn-dependent peptidase
MEKMDGTESERFKHWTDRLFDTELETVYEEFNRSQDNDGRWSLYQKVWTGLLPTHLWHTTTIGLGEHLKNRSMVNIHNYFNTYYCLNNIRDMYVG